MLNRILHGQYKFTVVDLAHKKHKLFMGSPSLSSRCISDEIYESTLEENLLEGYITRDNMDSFLLKHDLWSLEDQNLLDSLVKDIQELKVRMFKNAFSPYQLKKSREVLKLAVADIERLTQKKYEYDYITAEGMAEMEKNKFLIASSIKDKLGNPIIDEDSYLKFPSYLLEQAIHTYKQNRLSESDFRKLARDDVWRSFWTCKKENSMIFGKPIIEWSDEQRNLVIWSNLYDNIYEHTEKPSDDVIEDDDLLDGWMIIQRRKREQESKENKLANFSDNERIKNKSEIFLPAENREHMLDIAALNDEQNKRRKIQRLNYLANKGEVKESSMPDTKLEIHMELNKLAKEKIKNG